MNKKKTIAKNKMLPSFKELMNVLSTFTLVMLTFIIFKAESIQKAFDYFNSFFSLSLFSIPSIPSPGMVSAFTTLIFILFMLFIEWIARTQPYGLANIGLKWPKLARRSFYYILILAILLSAGEEKRFMYFQF